MSLKLDFVFSYKMSLKEGIRMLGIDHQHGRGTKTGSGGNPAFLNGSQEVSFQASDRHEKYEWVNRTLRQQDYGHLKRAVRDWCGATWPR